MAITTFSQNVAAFFAAGTSLGAYPESNYPAAHRPPTQGVAPLGAATATASVDSTGLVSFTGLADSTVYYLSDSGGTKHLRVTTLPSTVTENVGHKDRANGYAGLDANGRVPSADLTPASANVRDTLYGATGDGTTDDRAALQAAITAMAGNGDVFLPAGTYYLNSTGPLLLPPAATGLRIRGAGRNATVIKLSATVPRAFDLSRSADYDTFQNLELCDFTVDANSITTASNSHIVVGNVHNSTARQRVNVNGLAVRRVNTKNVPTLTTGSSRMNVAIQSRHLGSGETQTVLKNILVQDCDFQGGNTGTYISGDSAVSSSVNVYHDRIVVQRVNHDTLLLPNSQVSSIGKGAHVQIGGYGYGDNVLVTDCTGSYSGDVGVEIDGVNNALVDHCRMTDHYNGGILFRNFRAPLNLSAQKMTARDCVSVNHDHDPLTAAGPSPAFQVGGDSSTAAYVFGEAIFERCVHQIDSPLALAGSTAASTSASRGYSVYADNVQAAAIVVRGLRIGASALAVANNDVQRFPTFVGIRNALSGGRVLVENTHISLTGARTGTTNNQWRLIAIHGANVHVVVDNVTVDMAGFTGIDSVNDTFYWVMFNDFTSTIQGTVRRVKAVTAPITSSRHNGVFVGGTGTITINGTLLVAGCEFGKIVGSGSTQFDYSIDSTQIGKVRVADFATTRSSTSAMVTGRTAVTSGFTSGDLTSTSPAVIRNTDVIALDYVVKGGTVSAVERSDDNSTYDTVAAATGAEVLNVRPGQYVRVTYTVAPTVFKRPT